MATQADEKVQYKSVSDIKMYRPKQKLDKGQSGYKGRMGIYEVLENTTSIQKLIVGNATSEQIQEASVEDGMATMQVDGLVKSLIGHTSIEEILRVTRE